MDIPTMDDFRRIENRLDELVAMVSNAMAHTSANQTVTVSDICRIEGVSKSQILRKERYLLPNFGQSEYPAGVCRWKVETYIKWRGIPVNERYEMMVKHLDNVRLMGLKQTKKGTSPKV